jgi:hypothetical protein
MPDQVWHDEEFKLELNLTAKYPRDPIDVLDSLHGVGYQNCMKNSAAHSFVVIITIH